LGEEDSDTWLALVYALGFAAIAPVAGHLSDTFGRRYLAIIGTLLVIVGLVVTGTAHRMEVGIAGMAITGFGAGITQTISVAGVSEIVPVRLRGAYLGTIYLCFIPMAPASAYGIIFKELSDVAQLYSVTATWRWGAWIPLSLAGLALVLVLVGYHPPARHNSEELEKKEVVTRIDYLGCFLWVSGTGLFLMGVQWGGYN
jgi:MFS family permease